MANFNPNLIVVTDVKGSMIPVKKSGKCKVNPPDTPLLEHNTPYKILQHMLQHLCWTCNFLAYTILRPYLFSILYEDDITDSDCEVNIQIL